MSEKGLIQNNRIAGMNYYYRNFSLNYALQSMRKNGLKNIELWTCPQHYRISDEYRDSTKRISEEINRVGMNVVCITPQQGNPNAFNLSAKGELLIKGTWKYFKNIIDTADELGAQLVAVNPGWDYFDESQIEAWKRSIEMCKKVAEYANAKDIDIVVEALQPDESHLVNSIIDLYQYLNDVNHENVYVNLDVGAMARNNETIEQYFLTFGNRIKHCHFVDGDPVGHRYWGDGNRNPKTDFLTFNEYKYKGYFSFEFAQNQYFKQPGLIEKEALSNLNQFLI